MSKLFLTVQEQNIVNYLSTKNGIVNWEELVQFAKDPQNIKLKTLQRAVSEIKKKYTSIGIDLPFNVQFSTLVNPTIKTEQKLVQVKRTPDGNVMLAKDIRHPAQVDFAIDRNNKAVKSKFGYHKLNDDEFDMIKYFDANVGRVIKISELRDKVKYPQFGSKLPARWFDAIMRSINSLRRSVPGLKNRILTTEFDGETSYLYQ